MKERHRTHNSDPNSVDRQQFRSDSTRFGLTVIVNIAKVNPVTNNIYQIIFIKYMTRTMSCHVIFVLPYPGNLHHWETNRPGHLWESHYFYLPKTKPKKKKSV